MTASRASFRARLHVELDARRDPLADADLVAALDAHPEWLAEAVQMRADALALASLRPRRRRSRTRLAVVTAAAAVAVAAAILLSEPVPRPASRILAADLVEQRPRAWLAASWSVGEVLVADGSTHFTTSRLHSEPR